MTPLRDIQNATIDLFGRYPSADAGNKTTILRAVAEHLVEAREHFFTADGEIDYRGRTHAYRRFVGEVFAGANLPPAETRTLQAAARYHVGNILRERLDPETLSDLGLRQASPKERSAEKRASEGESLRVIRGGMALTAEDEIIEAIRVATSLIARIDKDAVRALPDESRQAIAVAIEAAGPIWDEAVGSVDDVSNVTR